MINGKLLLISFVTCCLCLIFVLNAQAQQTLGGITGTVEDSSGGVLANTTVVIENDQTKLSRRQISSAKGSYDFVNPAIGTYTLTFTNDGFETQKIPSIVVQADRTATVNASMKVIKMTQVTERLSVRFSFDVFNRTNTPSFDIPVNNMQQNLGFNDFPVYGSTLYSSPTLSGLGIVNKTIGSPRQIQMSLRVSF